MKSDSNEMVFHAEANIFSLAYTPFDQNLSKLDLKDVHKNPLSQVMEAERVKTESESVHLRKAASFQAAEEELQALEKKLSKVIQKSQPYFEQKEVFNRALDLEDAGDVPQLALGLAGARPVELGHDRVLGRGDEGRRTGDLGRHSKRRRVSRVCWPSGDTRNRQAG